MTKQIHYLYLYQIILSCTQKQIKMIIQTSKFWTFKGKLKDLVIYQCNGQTYARRKPDKEKFVISEGVKKQQERIAGVAALYQAAKKKPCSTNFGSKPQREADKRAIICSSNATSKALQEREK